jgi:crossover junction endodeoxyribonuclease RusA
MARRELILPHPPSVNTYWRHRIVASKGKPAFVSVYVSDQGKQFREEVEKIAEPIPKEQRIIGNGTLLRCHVLWFPKDARERDPDNICKGLLDSIKHAGFIRNDSDIWWLLVDRQCVSAPLGRVVVRLWPWNIRTWEEAA